MRVFATGATGYIGTAVVRALVRAGHSITGLVRSERGAVLLETLGARPLMGDLGDATICRDAASRHDATVHMAQEYTPLGPAKDRAATETLLGAASVFIYTSGVWVLGETGPTPVDDCALADHPAPSVGWRVEHEQLVLQAALAGLAASVIRPGIVYGGKGGLLAPMFETARAGGAAAYTGEGGNRWSLVHLDDLAALYELVLAKRASGVFHAVDGSPLPVREIAHACGRAAGAGGGTRSIPLEQARSALGPMADALVMDQAVIAPRALELGWKPERPNFLEAAEAAFAEWSA